MPAESPLSIEVGLPDDLEAIEALLPRLADFEVPGQRHPEDLWHGDRQLVREWAIGKRSGVRVFVARAETRILGVAVSSAREELLTHAPSVHLEILSVAREAEGQGIAKALLQAVESAARTAGASLISLHVFTNNQRARSLYQHYGFDEEILRCVKHLSD